MSAAYRPAPAATVLRAVIAVIAVLLFLTCVLDIVTDTDSFDQLDTGIKITVIGNCLSYFVLAGIAGAALMTRRFALDLLLVAATGWAVAWAFNTGPAGLPYIIEFSNEEYNPIEWTNWTAAILGLLLAVVSAGFLATILRGTSGGAERHVSTTSTGPAAAGPPSAIPAGWHTDPSGAPRQERWWDGSTWTDHVRDTR